MPVLKCGKAPAKRDSRNLQMKMVLRRITPPPTYDFDAEHPGIPTPMFANDQYGDCVIAGRAHQTLRFELSEQGQILPITDQDVLAEWQRENGGTEDGLIMLESLKSWRKDGWLVGGKRYFIQAFAEIDRRNTNEVRRTVYSNLGTVVGLSLPDNALEDFTQGRPWNDISRPPDQYNGHCVYIPAYNETGPVCVTWGRRQQMSWGFLFRYCDEAYGIVDAKNDAIRASLLEQFLAQLAPRNEGTA